MFAGTSNYFATSTPAPVSLTNSSGTMSAEKLKFAVPQGGPEDLLRFVRKLSAETSPSKVQSDLYNFDKRKGRADPRGIRAHPRRELDRGQYSFRVQL